MKKISTFALVAMISSATFAASTSTQEDKSENATLPTIYLSVFDKTQDPSPDLNKKEISHSNKNEKICWVATGAFAEQETVIETFKAPAKMKFTINNIEGAKVVSSPDKKVHTITYTRPTIENGKYMMNCWLFEKQDPIGKYVLTVKIGEQELEKQVFYIKK